MTLLSVFAPARRSALRVRVLATLAVGLTAGCVAPEQKDGLDVDGSTVGHVVIAPRNVVSDTNIVTQFTAVGITIDGATVPVNVRWGATGGTIDANGRFTSDEAGMYLVRVSTTDEPYVSDSTLIDVIAPATLRSITVTPATGEVTPGQTLTFDAVGGYTDNSNRPVSVDWTAEAGTFPAGSTGPQGVYQAPATTGTYRVFITRGALRDTAVVTVNATAPTLTAIEVSPSTASVVANGTRQFTAVGRLSNGTTTFTAVKWSATGGTVTQNGLYTAPSASGTYRVIVRQDGGPLADTATVTVTQVAVLQGIDVTPSTTELLIGTTMQFTVLGRLSNGQTTPVTVNWTTSGGGTITTGGLFTAPTTAGQVRVIATQTTGGSFRDTSFVTVAATLPPPSGPAPEPTGSSTILWQDQFENGVNSYAKRGRVEIVNTGRSGNAVRFPYSGQSPDNLIEKNFSSSTDLYVRYWYRLSPNADPTSGNRNPSGMKWFMFWRSTGPRYTNGVGNLSGGPAGFTNSGLEFSVHDNGSTRQPNPFMQNIGKARKFGTTRDGNWHKYTLHTVTGNNGYEQIWVDDVLVLDSRGFGYDHVADGVSTFQMPGLVVSGPQPGFEFTIDIDDFVLWRN